MKIGSNKDINKDHKKLPVAKTDVTRHDPVGERRLYNLNLRRMLTENHNYEKLAISILIVGVGLIAYNFFKENKWHQYYLQPVVPW